MDDMKSKGRGRLPVMVGSNNARAKLSEQDIIAIRSLRLAGWTYKRLASEFAVAVPTIGQLCRGENWRHV